MPRTLSNLIPPLVLAVATLVATGLANAAPRVPWSAGPLVLVLALLLTDVAARRRAGRRPWPSASALLLALILLLASGILALDGPGPLAGMMPILGACAALPALLASERATCRRAGRGSEGGAAAARAAAPRSSS